jgi:tRNA dimethylallyltransferase
MINLLAIVGPTASGKTALAIDIAKKHNGEIIAADSRTAYSLLDIGTAKPTLIERQKVPHWGLDLVGPGQKLSVADFKKYADNKIQDIQKRHRLPILVGGSGLYIDAVLYDFSFAPARPDLRQSLEGKTVAELQQEIIDRHFKMPQNHLNKRYLIRALERGEAPLAKKSLGSQALVVGLNPTKENLKKRIAQRAHKMLADGVIDEIKLAAMQYGWGSEAMTGGIYRAFRPFLAGTINQGQAIQNYIASDIRLAKKQMTWFKRNSDINWFESVVEASDWLDKQISGTLER